MSSFKLTILGSGSALPTLKRFPTAQVLNVHERFFLIDCGEGAQLQLRKYHFKLGRLNHIFISHAHGDHIFGLYGLISTLNLLGQRSDINIYGPPILNETLLHYQKNFGNDLKFKIVFHPWLPKESTLIFENKSLTVHTIPLKHRIHACGFLFKEKPWIRNIKKEKIQEYQIPVREIPKIKEGADFVLNNGQVISNKEITLPTMKQRSFAYCSDTAYSEKIIPFVKNVDLLYHESTFLKTDAKLAKDTGHSTSVQAAKIANLAAVKKLLLGHFSSRYKDEYMFLHEAKEVFQNSYLVNDGDEYEIPMERIIE